MRDVSDDLAKLCGIAGGVSVAVHFWQGPEPALLVAVSMLSLLMLALVSPRGPTVLFDEPGVSDDG